MLCSKTCKKSCQLVIGILCLGYIAFRIVEWNWRYLHWKDTSSRYILALPTDEHLQNAGVKIEQPVYVSICNLNKVRGTALIQQTDGTQLYDHIADYLQNFQTSDYTNSSSNEMNELFWNLGHNLPDSLKICQLDGKPCRIKDFQSFLSNLGLCHFIKVDQKSDKQSKIQVLTLALDSQEYEYMVPNNGSVGFYLTVSNSPWKKVEKSFDQIHPQFIDHSQALILGSAFQTVIGVSQSTCSSLHYPTRENCFSPTDCERYHISSVTQTMKSSFFSRLVLNNDFGNFNRDSVEVMFGTRVQQRAYLRSANRTGFELLLSVADKLTTVQRQNLDAWRILDNIQSNLMKNLSNLQTIKTKSSSMNCLSDTEKLLEELSIILIKSRSEWSNWTIQNPTNPLSQRKSIRAHFELFLVDKFYSANSNMSPSRSILRDLIREIMGIERKFKLPSRFNLSWDLSSEHKQICEQVMIFYTNLLRELGSIGSAVASGLDTMNSWMESLINHNSLIIHNFPNPNHQLSKININNLVTAILRINRSPTNYFEYIPITQFHSLTNEIVTLLLEVITMIAITCILVQIVLNLCKSRSKNSLNLRNQNSILELIHTKPSKCANIPDYQAEFINTLQPIMRTSPQERQMLSTIASSPVEPFSYQDDSRLITTFYRPIPVKHQSNLIFQDHHDFKSDFSRLKPHVTSSRSSEEDSLTDPLADSIMKKKRSCVGLY